MVPAGTTVHTSSWTTTHERSYFTNHRSFCPERWLPPSHRFYSSTFNTDDKGAARPFSLGPRGCLGLNLALLEMRKALAMLVWCFDWELVNAHDIDWERDPRFEGFWQIPEPRVRFVSVR